MVNSARVTGGTPPPLHFRTPPQSPVVHFPEPELSNVQPVRPQNRPDQPGGAWSWTDEPGDNAKPPSPSAAPLPESEPGQTVKLQSFWSVKRVAEEIIVPNEKRFNRKRRKTPDEIAIDCSVRKERLR